MKISNPKKKVKTDVINQNQVIYKNVLKKTDVFYDIFPEKIQEIISVRKKRKNKSLSFQIGTSITTQFTDADGVSTSKGKITYNKRKEF